jgi:hypothetical protein
MSPSAGGRALIPRTCAAGVLQMWNVSQGQPMKLLKTGMGSCQSLTFIPGTKQAVATFKDGSVSSPTPALQLAWRFLTLYCSPASNTHAFHQVGFHWAPGVANARPKHRTCAICVRGVQTASLAVGAQLVSSV